ncbi:MAG: hypothetical protein QOI15_3084 [Pseudonocardiales bacterium]|nr:hypothetical protein [Pseudonocardiales bacterium]
MRRLITLVAIAAATLGVAVTVESTSAGAARGDAPTQITIVRPVNGAGYARTGFTVRAEPTGGVDCSFADPSPAAVSPNIEWCSPSAAYAVACWNAHAAGKVLCMRNPRARKLVRIPRLGAFAPTGLAPQRERAPLSMVLGNSDSCSIRDGGTGAIRIDHPQWIATYYCDSGKIIWMRPGDHHLGIFERFPTWSVVVAGASGPISARHVARAWFVGTYTGG